MAGIWFYAAIGEIPAFAAVRRIGMTVGGRGDEDYKFVRFPLARE